MKFALVMIFMVWQGESADVKWKEQRQEILLPSMYQCEYLLNQKSITQLSTNKYRYIGGYCEKR